MVLVSLQISSSTYWLGLLVVGAVHGATVSLFRGFKTYVTPAVPEPGNVVGKIVDVANVPLAATRSRSRTSSIPAFAEKNARCSSLKLELVPTSVLVRIMMPAATAVISAMPFSCCLALRLFFLLFVFDIVVVHLLLATHGLPDGSHGTIVKRNFS